LGAHVTGTDVMNRIAARMIGCIFTSFAMELLVYPAIYAIWRGREVPAREPPGSAARTTGQEGGTHGGKDPQVPLLRRGDRRRGGALPLLPEPRGGARPGALVSRPPRPASRRRGGGDRPRRGAPRLRRPARLRRAHLHP